MIFMWLKLINAYQKPGCVQATDVYTGEYKNMLFAIKFSYYITLNPQPTYNCALPPQWWHMMTEKKQIPSKLRHGPQLHMMGLLHDSVAQSIRKVQNPPNPPLKMKDIYIYIISFNRLGAFKASAGWCHANPHVAGWISHLVETLSGDARVKTPKLRPRYSLSP